MRNELAEKDEVLNGEMKEIKKLSCEVDEKTDELNLFKKFDVEKSNQIIWLKKSVKDLQGVKEAANGERTRHEKEVNRLLEEKERATEESDILYRQSQKDNLIFPIQNSPGAKLAFPVQACPGLSRLITH